MKRKKVALITPPYHSGVVESAGTWLNLGFVSLAGSLRAAGCEVDYYDAMALWHGWEEIRARIRDFGPDVVATTAYTASVVDALALLRAAKEIRPDVVTVIGNVHATFCYGELLADPDTPVDYVVRGEGEQTLVALLACLDAGDDPARVAGIAFRAEGRVVATPESGFIADLDRLPMAWDLVDWPSYTYYPEKDSTLAIVSSSRGCRQNCSFCSQQLFWRRSWRGRSPESFVAELEMLKRSFGVNVVMLADEIPTLDRYRWHRILDLLIERRLGIKLLMETRVDDILRDAGSMERYREAGVEHIYVGVEAGSQALLDLFRKGTRVEQSRRAIELINRADIVSETSFVLGMPGDTPESIAAVVELAMQYDPDMAFFLAIAPWPYADLYPQLERYVATKDYRRYNLVEPVLKPTAMSLEEVGIALGEAARKFYLNRFRNLPRLSAWKRGFMIEVFRILVNNSYLATRMRALAGDREMPEEMRRMLARIGGDGRKPDDSSTIAPIP
ncbi:MAG: cobalamin-dependent protein [Thermodesulfobacteriota bacterium]